MEPKVNYLIVGTFITTLLICMILTIIWLSFGFSFNSSHNKSETEETLLVKMPFKKAVQMVRSGKISDQRTALAILWYAEFRP